MSVGNDDVLLTGRMLKEPNLLCRACEVFDRAMSRINRPARHHRLNPQKNERLKFIVGKFGLLVFRI